MSDESIYNFLISIHLNGRYGFTEDGFNHYLTILKLINNKMFNPLEPEINRDNKINEILNYQNFDISL